MKAETKVEAAETDRCTQLPFFFLVTERISHFVHINKEEL